MLMLAPTLMFSILTGLTPFQYNGKNAPAHELPATQPGALDDSGDPPPARPDRNRVEAPLSR